MCVNLNLSVYPSFPFRLGNHMFHFGEVQFSSVAQSCPTLCDPMNRSTPGLPVHHQLTEFTQTHVHGVSDAIQPSHPPSSPSPPAHNPSQHQRWQNLKVKALVAQLSLTIFDPVNCSPPGSSSMEFSKREYWSG